MTPQRKPGKAGRVPGEVLPNAELDDIEAALDSGARVSDESDHGEELVRDLIGEIRRLRKLPLVESPRRDAERERLKDAVIKAAMRFTRAMEKAANHISIPNPHTGYIETACYALAEHLRKRDRRGK